MFQQEAESKYKNVRYRVDDTSKGKNLFLDAVPGQRELANLSGFQFSQAILTGNLIDSELGEVLTGQQKWTQKIHYQARYIHS